jgi:4-carboxymuconolactone decarboxylase
MTQSLPDDLAVFYDSYIAPFGAMPPLPAAKFESTAAIDPEA